MQDLTAKQFHANAVRYRQLADEATDPNIITQARLLAENGPYVNMTPLPGVREAGASRGSLGSGDSNGASDSQ
jgi:hypothetical protein